MRTASPAGATVAAAAPDTGPVRHPGRVAATLGALGIVFGDIASLTDTCGKGGEQIMTGWPGLDRLLTVDPADGGCAHAMELLHVYAELLAADRDAAAHHPTIAAHLAACGPCAEDLAGLLAALERPA